MVYSKVFNKSLSQRIVPENNPFIIIGLATEITLYFPVTISKSAKLKTVSFYYFAEKY